MADGGEWMQGLGPKRGPDAAEDAVNHPKHYTSGAVECIEAIESAMTRVEFIGFLRGQVIKYVWRCTQKGTAVQDVQKAGWYLKLLEEKLRQ